jgi:pantoate--beta-alanine ligase
MHILSGLANMRQFSKRAHNQGLSIGLVPTMGALHQGHIKLIHACKEQNDLSICSIFVNPKQFNSLSDLEHYPRNLERDFDILQAEGCDVVFCPNAEDMYPKIADTVISFGQLENLLEGQYRPGHFRGVALVVCKLFNLTIPTRAYFGQKDFQQLKLVEMMTESLDFGIEIVPVATVREADGLALSSRNQLLGPEERAEAGAFFEALTLAKTKLIEGESVMTVKQMIDAFFQTKNYLRLEYFEVVKNQTLEPIEAVAADNETTLCIAGYAGNVRLIDNISLI